MESSDTAKPWWASELMVGWSEEGAAMSLRCKCHVREDTTSTAR